MDEMIEVLDNKGVSTGEVRTKAEIHKVGLWHRTAHVWIVTSEGNLLLQRRGPNMPTYPNCWDISSAGHISAGEPTVVGAQREILEELKISIPENKLEFLGTVRSESIHQDGKYINREFQDVFLVTMDINLSSLTPQASEVIEFVFWPWQELQKRAEAQDPELVPHPNEYAMLFEVMGKRYPHA